MKCCTEWSKVIYSLVAMVLNSHMWCIGCVFLPSHLMETGVQSPSAPHAELLSPLLLRKPSSHTKVATLLYVVPVTDSRTASFAGAGWPQSTTEEGRFQSHGYHGYHQFALPVQEALSLRGLKGSFPFRTWYPSWQLHSKLPGRFVHWVPSPHTPVILHSSTSAQATSHKGITISQSCLVQGPAGTHPDSGFHRWGWRRPCCWTGCSRSGRYSSSCRTCCGRWCSDRRFY